MWSWNRKQQQQQRWCETASAVVSHIWTRPWTYFFCGKVHNTCVCTTTWHELHKMRKTNRDTTMYFNTTTIHRTNLISSNIFARINWINRRRISRCKHFYGLNIFIGLMDFCCSYFDFSNFSWAIFVCFLLVLVLVFLLQMNKGTEWILSLIYAFFCLIIISSCLCRYISHTNLTANIICIFRRIHAKSK